MVTSPMSRYPLDPADRPTEEEIGQVDAYWQRVRRVTQNLAGNSGPVPDSDLVVRVGLHHQWEQDMQCRHSSYTITHDAITCGDCDRPLQVLSDIQVRELRHP